VSATPSADIPQFEINSGPGPEDVRVVRVRGEVDMSHEDELRSELRAAVAADARGIVVDLTECEFIDSTALGILVGANKQLRKLAGGVSIISAEHDIRKMFEITGLDSMFAIHPSLAAARNGEAARI
jgi:anti-sigma B factor antagonist